MSWVWNLLKCEGDKVGAVNIYCLYVQDKLKWITFSSLFKIDFFLTLLLILRYLLRPLINHATLYQDWRTVFYSTGLSLFCVWEGCRYTIDGLCAFSSAISLGLCVAPKQNMNNAYTLPAPPPDLPSINILALLVFVPPFFVFSSRREMRVMQRLVENKILNSIIITERCCR